MVGAREARRLLKRVGVLPEREKGVVERGGSVATAVFGDTLCMRGLGLRAACFSSTVPAEARLARSWSVRSSPVLVVLRFVPVCGFNPSTVADNGI